MLIVVSLVMVPMTLLAAEWSEVTDERLLEADKDANNWLSYYPTYDGWHHSPLSQINAQTVKQLAEWLLSLGSRTLGCGTVPSIQHYEAGAVLVLLSGFLLRVVVILSSEGVYAMWHGAGTAVVLMLLVGLGACTSPEASWTRGGGLGSNRGNRDAAVEMHAAAQPYYQTPCRLPFDCRSVPGTPGEAKQGLLKNTRQQEP